MSTFYTIDEVSKMLNVTHQTLRNWDKSGKFVPALRKETGRRFYSEEQINEYLGTEVKPKKVIGYCRVSSHGQKDDLERQVGRMTMYLQSKNEDFEIITDIGSGINYKNKGLRSLIQKLHNGEVSKIVVLYKDRLLRFGYELVEYYAELSGATIEILDTQDKTREEELVEDLVQIITVFSSRLQGRRYVKTAKMVEELISDVSSSESQDTLKTE